MKRALCLIDGVYRINEVTSISSIPASQFVAELPPQLAMEHPDDLIVTTTTDEFGFEQTVVTLDQAKKDARLLLEANKQTEYLWDEMRDKRNALLKETDYLMLSDVPVENLEAVKAYRQALRDLPETIIDITNFQWPELKTNENF